MNSTIQQPTTLIKIRKNYTASTHESDEDVKMDKGIDFYDFEFNKKTTSDFLRAKRSNSLENLHEDTIIFYEKKGLISTDCDQFKGERLTINDESFLKMPLDINLPFDQKSNENCEIFPFSCLKNENLGKKTNSRNLDIMFVIDNLKFDLRVKEFSVTPDYVLVYFFCQADSLSFYRQYYHYLDLSFSSSCDWLSPSTTPQLTDSFDIGVGNSFIVEQIGFTEAKPFKEEVCAQEIYSRKRFEEKIDYFNQLKSSFSKADLKIMMINLEKRTTDFVFSNTKELAVGSKSNKIMQEAIKIMSGEELDRVYECLEYDIVPISATKHGAYTIQTLLTFSTNKSHKLKVTKYFAKEGEFLLAHEIGNYTFQKIIPFNNELVCNFFVSNFEDVLKTELGMKVFKRCVEHLDAHKESLLDKINEYKDKDIAAYTQLKQTLKNL